MNDIELFDFGIDKFWRKMHKNMLESFEMFTKSGFLAIPEIHATDLSMNDFKEHMEKLTKEHPDAKIQGYFYSYEKKAGEEAKEEKLEFSNVDDKKSVNKSSKKKLSGKKKSSKKE